MESGSRFASKKSLGILSGRHDIDKGLVGQLFKVSPPSGLHRQNGAGVGFGVGHFGKT